MATCCVFVLNPGVFSAFQMNVYNIIFLLLLLLLLLLYNNISYVTVFGFTRPMSPMSACSNWLLLS